MGNAIFLHIIFYDERKVNGKIAWPFESIDNIAVLCYKGKNENKPYYQEV